MAKKVVDLCKKCGEDPCACVKVEVKESGKPVLKTPKKLKPKTEMRMLGGRMREVEVE